MHRYPKARWIVAFLFAVAAVAPLSSWWLLLFHDVAPPHLSATDAVLGQLGATFSFANPERWWFIGFALIPFFLIGVAIFFSSPLVRSRWWSVAVALSASLVTLYCLLFVPSLGLFLFVPLGLAVWWAHGA